MFDILNINGYIQVRDEHNETEQSAPSERRSFLWRQWRLIAEFLVLAIVSGCFLWIRENQLQTTKPLSASQVPFEQVRFNGTFGLESAFTGVGPDVDAAWDEITGGIYAPLTRSTINSPLTKFITSQKRVSKFRFQWSFHHSSSSMGINQLAFHLPSQDILP